MSQEGIHVRDGKVTAYVGRPAVDIVRMISLKGALGMYDKFKMRPSRHISPTSLLKMAEEYTGKKYKGASKYRDAQADMVAVIAAAREAVTVVEE